jgi:hypothetical protein
MEELLHASGDAPGAEEAEAGYCVECIPALGAPPTPPPLPPVLTGHVSSLLPY